MLILGISGLRHHSTASLTRDGEVLAACEEAKLSGRELPVEAPRAAIRFCLERAGVTAGDIEGIAIDAPLRVREQMDSIRVFREMFPEAEIAFYDHHPAHAASTFFASGFERALVVTLDSGGGWTTGLVALGEGAELRPLATSNFPDSPGFLYSQVTTMLGWRSGEDEHRTQWLSTIGRPERKEVFDRIFEPLWDGDLRINHAWLNAGSSEKVCLSQSLLEELDVPGADWRNAAAMPEAARANIAASLQAALEDAMVALALTWRQKTEAHALCLGGGLAFNALLVEALALRAGFETGFVSPVAGNSGCALGAAWLMGASRGVKPAGASFTPYLGPSFTGQQIKDLLDNCRLPYRNLTPPQMTQEVSDRLADGQIVAWFQGAAEFGPRALGNRSILAAPTNEWVKENLNKFTKRREGFRPLAASVIEESAADLFEFPWSSPPTFLGTVSRVRDRDAIPGLAFAGDRARVHVVSRAANRPFHDLLTRVGQLTGRPLVINTSFNAPGEPLVVTPQEALRVFFSTGIDSLSLGDFLITK